MKLRIGIAAVVILSTQAWSFPQETKGLSSQPTAIQSQEMPKPEIDKSLEALVNRNTSPDLSNERRATFEKGFDWEEYHRVWELLRQISLKTEVLWPALISHLEDDRYCTTVVSSSGVQHNWTVGDVCWELMSATLGESYLKHMNPKPRLLQVHMGRPNFAREKLLLIGWCRERSSLSLSQMQIESCKWAMDELKAKPIPRVSKQVQQDWINSIERGISELSESKRPILSNWFKGEMYSPCHALKDGK